MAKHDHHNTARAIIAFLLILIMARIFFLFYENSEAIIQSDQFYIFMTLAVFAGGLMLGLLYLAGKKPHVHKVGASKISSKTVSKKVSKKSTKKKRTSK